MKEQSFFQTAIFDKDIDELYQILVEEPETDVTCQTYQDFFDIAPQLNNHQLKLKG